jgi:hypothetical protein
LGGGFIRSLFFKKGISLFVSEIVRAISLNELKAVFYPGLPRFEENRGKCDRTSELMRGPIGGAFSIFHRIAAQFWEKH